MPNTLGHFGIQGAASRVLFGHVDPRWIMIGCVIPDVPWITQRVAQAVAPGLDPYGMRLYFVAQASLVGSLVLCAACAVLTRKPRLLFFLLGFNVLAHLLLDACQTKWGNGIAMMAPISWSLWNFELFWPEHWLSHGLTGLGVLFVAWAWRHGLWGPLELDTRHWPLALLLLLVYATLPAALVPSAYEADVHDTKTLKEARIGEAVAFDREEFDHRLKPWNHRAYTLRGQAPSAKAIVSLEGVLVAADTLRVEQLHIHAGRSRDIPTLLGLGILATALLVGLRRRRAAQTSL
jgi:hypothetical protein